MKIIKRSGQEADYDVSKIENAVIKANKSVPETERMTDKQIEVIIDNILRACRKTNHTLSVEEIQDMVENEIMNQRAFTVARSYITYRYRRALIRKANSTDEQIMTLIECDNEEIKQENSNKNPTICSVQRDYMAGEVSKDISERFLLPEDVIEAHKQGIIHFHDMDYFAQHMHNCCLANLEDMLQNGTVITSTKIDKPKSFMTAANITGQIIAQISSNQYGGQTINIAHLVPFIEISRQKHRKEIRTEAELTDLHYTDEQANAIAEHRLKKEIKAGVQTIQYQLLTIMTTNGQTPFVSLYMNINDLPEGQERNDMAMLMEEILKQRMEGIKNEKDVYITPAFPKLLYVLDENNAYEGSEYFWLTQLAARCTAKRMVPDYISAKIMREQKRDVYGCMGCRSFLTPDRFTDKGVGNMANANNYEPGSHKYWGRFNQGVVSINLPYIACESNGNMEKFWQILDSYLELCHKALRYRHDRLKGTPSDVAPILWQHGALARLRKGETIDRLLYDGYSTISLGYAGLYECCMRMTGCSHTTETGRPFALKVMQYMNEKCTKWKKAENIDYSLYGTPLESTTYKFAKALQKNFGTIKDVSDHNYITNSYHVVVREEIDAFTKLKFESEFQALSPGGAISYIETPNMQDNIDAVLSVVQYIYENIMYAELNTKSDYCQKCGYDGEIRIKTDDHGKLIWECPNCGNTDQNTMNVARRTCGYIGTQYWNQGRTQEIKDRVLHL